MKNDRKPSTELIMAGYLMTTIEEICKKDELKPCDIISFAGCEALLDQLKQRCPDFYNSIIGEFKPFLILIQKKIKDRVPYKTKIN